MENKKLKSPLPAIYISLSVSLVIAAIVVGSFTLFPGTSMKQVNRDGVVKIVAKYMQPENNREKGTSFSLLIETHTDDFDVYDVRRLSFLRIDGGKLQPAYKWAPYERGHHLDGTIKFAQELQAGTHNLELIIKNIEGVNERILEWQITVKS